MTKKHKRSRSDPQLSGMAGEFLVAGKLFKRRMQVSVTMGNAKAIDLFAHNPQTGRTFNVQVKTLRQKNCFPMKRESLIEGHVFVFVILNKDDQQEEFYIVPASVILKDINHFFGTSYIGDKAGTFPAVNYGPLKEYKDNWDIFEAK